MSNFTDFFPAAGGGGGGGIPKYQEFTSSGTFTPSQALIDAGGRVAFLMVAGGGGTDDFTQGPAGGQVRLGYATLTSTTGCTVTIGAGAPAGHSGSGSTSGGDTIIDFSSAGGTTETAKGGLDNGLNGSYGAGWGSRGGTSTGLSAGPGVLGYGVGGTKYAGSAGFNSTAKNYGAGDSVASGSTSNAGPGFVRITWFE